MKEYYQCKRCYSYLSVRRIARHHTKVHPDVPHDIYLDNFFDLERPLFKCDFCSCKLTQKRIKKHLKQAHLLDNYPFKTKLPFTQTVPAVSRSTMPMVELSSDSMAEMLIAKKTKHLNDKSRDERTDAIANSKQRKFNEVSTQTSKKLYASPIKKCMQLSLEYDKDDGWLELVLS